MSNPYQPTPHRASAGSAARFRPGGALEPGGAALPALEQWRDGPPRDRLFGWVVTVLAAPVVAAIVADFVLIYPLLTGQPLTSEQWQWRLWLPGWE